MSTAVVQGKILSLPATSLYLPYIYIASFPMDEVPYLKHHHLTLKEQARFKSLLKF